MNFNNAGLALIKSFEGVRLRAYQDMRGIWTIGYGHTGPDVHAGQVINEREAEQYLKGDLLRFEHGVEQAVAGVPTTDNEFTAMVCLAFNIGMGNFKTTSVLKYHLMGKKKLAAAAFMLWVNVGKIKKVRGLIRRRDAEAKLYVS